MKKPHKRGVTLEYCEPCPHCGGKRQWLMPGAMNMRHEGHRLDYRCPKQLEADFRATTGIWPGLGPEQPPDPPVSQEPQWGPSGMCSFCRGDLEALQPFGAGTRHIEDKKPYGQCYQAMMERVRRLE